MYRKFGEAGSINISDPFQLEYLEHYANRGSYRNEKVWLRRLVVIASQYQRGQEAPPLAESHERASARVGACAELANWMWQSGGMTQAEIADYLNDQGQTTARGLRWSQGTLNRYLARSAAHR